MAVNYTLQAVKALAPHSPPPTLLQPPQYTHTYSTALLHSGRRQFLHILAFTYSTGIFVSGFHVLYKHTSYLLSHKIAVYFIAFFWLSHRVCTCIFPSAFHLVQAQLKLAFTVNTDIFHSDLIIQYSYTSFQLSYPILYTGLESTCNFNLPFT